MLISLILWSLAVISLALVLLILPVLLLHRFLSVAASVDEVEERWIRRYGDLSPPFVGADAVRRLRAVPLRG